jgi:PAS domain S-box-containing protein
VADPHASPIAPQASLLVVDDDRSNLLALEAVLEPLGQRVVTARSGEAALRHLLDGEFAVVLLDVSMPGLSGFQTAALMRQRERTRRVPIIFLTGVSTGAEHIIEGYAQGAVDYMVKPYNVDILRSKVSVFVDLYLAREELRRLSVNQARRSEAEAERRRLQKMLYEAPVAIAELDGPEHRIVFANPRIEHLVNRRELVGKTVLEAMPSLAGSPLMELLDHVLRSGEAVAVSELGLPIDREGRGVAETAFFSFNLEPRRDDEGRVTGLIGAAVDVTEQVTARRRSEEAVRVRDEFIAIATHELRTPLTTLRLQTDSLAHLLRAGRLDEERARGKLELVRRQIDRLDALVGDLVDVTRLTAGRLELSAEPFDLGELAREVGQRFADELARAGCELVLECERELVGSWDRFRIDQVITNLVTNAMKYGRGKPIEIAVRRRDGKAELSVRDQGVGIAQADQGRIFEQFERASSGRLVGGLGLGLWIAHRIVSASGGSIAVESALGAGARFTVTLPLA